MSAPLTEDELLRLEDEHRSLRERGECMWEATDGCPSCAEFEAHPVARLLREVRRLQRRVDEHHRLGGLVKGEACPICNRLKET